MDSHKRIEYPASGATYTFHEFGVYEYSVYGPESVLEGESRRVFLETFPTLAAARQAHPDAIVTASCDHAPAAVRT